MKAQQKKKIRYNGKLEPSGNPWSSLAQAIVYQAVLDWKAIDDGRPIAGVNYAALRNFFLSPWCETLLLFTGLDPRMIVERLEADTIREAHPL